MMSRIQELQRVRAAKAQKMEQMKKQREEIIKEAASKYTVSTPGQMINWNRVVTVKREKLKFIQRLDREQRRREEQPRSTENLREYMYKAIINQGESKHNADIFAVFRQM